MKTFRLTRGPQALPPDTPTEPLIKHPLIRLVTYVGLGTIWVFLILLFGGLVKSVPMSAVVTLMTASIAVMYVLACRYVERRPRPFELSPARAGGLAWGVGLGVALVAAVVGILVALGAVKLTGAHPLDGANVFFIVAFMGVLPAVLEEIIFRGVLLRLVDEALGGVVALLVSSAFFGIAHATNPGANFVSTLSIVVGPGLLFGGLYLLTRSLWLVMGLHFAWNVALGLTGLPVSGVPRPGLWTWERSGSTLMNGGNFGPEASLPALLIVGGTAIAIVVLVIRRGLLVAPPWRRQPIQGETHEETGTLNP